jgi:hypothetical protein
MRGAPSTGRVEARVPGETVQDSRLLNSHSHSEPIVTTLPNGASQTLPSWDRNVSVARTRPTRTRVLDPQPQRLGDLSTLPVRRGMASSGRPQRPREMLNAVWRRASERRQG